MLEVFTVGGGEYLVNTFNAVAAWSGGGGYRSLLRVVMVMGLIYSLLVVAFTLNFRAWMNWFLQATAIYLCLMVPTISVKVTDRINPSLAPAVVDNVPLGLGVLASFTTQVGDWLTRTAETVFVMPGELNYTTNGMVYGARLFDATRNFVIRDAEFATNLEEHFKKCLFGDVMLYQKSLTNLASSNDLWTDIGPGSEARSQEWLERQGDGTVQNFIITCRQAYQALDAQWAPMIEANAPLWGKELYPKLSNTLAANKLKHDLPIVNAAFTGSGHDFTATMRQNTAINAFMQARNSMAGGSGAASIDTFAQTRADIQARNTYASIAQQAMAWVPILNIVLTVVFFAMFPVIFPLFLMPQTGVGSLKGYAMGFFYLAAWGPLYVILHMICMTRAESAAAGVGQGGQGGRGLGRLVPNVGGGVSVSKAGQQADNLRHSTDDSRSSDSSSSTSSGVRDEHSNGSGATSSDGTYDRSGVFSRATSSSSSSRSTEDSLALAKSYSEAARKMEELSQSLSRDASFAETHGMQLSRNMSQDLAQWYREQQALHPNMDAPELWATDLTAHQAAVREDMVQRWAQEKRDDLWSEIRGDIAEPDLVQVHRPATSDAGDVRAAYRPHAVEGLPKGPGGGDPGAAARIIDSGRVSLGEDRAVAQATRATRVQGSVDVQSEVSDDHNKGFFNNPELRK